MGVAGNSEEAAAILDQRSGRGHVQLKLLFGCKVRARRLRLPRFGATMASVARSINSALPHDSDTPADLHTLCALVPCTRYSRFITVAHGRRCQTNTAVLRMRLAWNSAAWERKGRNGIAAPWLDGVWSVSAVLGGGCAAWTVPEEGTCSDLGQNRGAESEHLDVILRDSADLARASLISLSKEPKKNRKICRCGRAIRSVG